MLDSLLPFTVVGISMVIRYTPDYPDDLPNICFVDAVSIPEDDIISLTQMVYVVLFLVVHL